MFNRTATASSSPSPATLDIATVDDLDRVVRDLRAVEWSEIVLDLRRLDLLAEGSPAVARLLELTGTRDRFHWTKGP